MSGAKRSDLSCDTNSETFRSDPWFHYLCQTWTHPIRSPFYMRKFTFLKKACFIVWTRDSNSRPAGAQEVLSKTLYVEALVVRWAKKKSLSARHARHTARIVCPNLDHWPAFVPGRPFPLSIPFTFVRTVRVRTEMSEKVKKNGPIQILLECSGKRYTLPCCSPVYYYLLPGNYLGWTIACRFNVTN